MIAIMGITGNVGGEVARNLLAAQQPIRGVVRDVVKCGEWAQRCRELVQADINDAASLTAAFQGAEGVFVLVPPNFDPSPDFREAQAVAVALMNKAFRPSVIVGCANMASRRIVYGRSASIAS